MARRDPYRDRAEAGEVLAAALADALADRLVGSLGDEPSIVLALPRGGVPVAVPVARRLAAPLGLMLVRKLGVPGRPELAMGAIARTGDVVEIVRHERVIAEVRLDEAAFERVRRREEAALAERAERYGAPAQWGAPPDVQGRTVVLVDDGLATGMTALAAVLAARALRPNRVVLAAPVGSPIAVELVGREADLVVCPLAPPGVSAVSQWYLSFDQLSDAAVLDALARAHRP
jgi:predicted phosphoribosyltransferase